MSGSPMVDIKREGGEPTSRADDKSGCFLAQNAQGMHHSAASTRKIKRLKVVCIRTTDRAHQKNCSADAIFSSTSSSGWSMYEHNIVNSNYTAINCFDPSKTGANFRFLVTPGISSTEYRERRKTFMSRLPPESFAVSMFVLIFSANLTAPSQYLDIQRDSCQTIFRALCTRLLHRSFQLRFPFRQRTNFMYLSGFIEPEAHMIICTMFFYRVPAFLSLPHY